MQFSKKQLSIMLAVGLTLMLFVLIGAFTQNNTKTNSTTSEITAASPPEEAISTIKQFLSLRNSSQTADQASPSAWIGKTKTLTTAAYFTRLQPVNTGSTGSTTAEFVIGHTNKLYVKTDVRNCVWDRDVVAPTMDSGAVICSVYAITTDSASNPLPTASIPFGWSYSGQQPAAIIKIELHNSRWLIADDLTGVGA